MKHVATQRAKRGESESINSFIKYKEFEECKDDEILVTIEHL